MEVGNLISIVLPLAPKRRRFPSCQSTFPRSVKTSLSSQGDYRGPKPKREWVADWVSKNDDVVRSLPIYVGGISVLAVLFNRTVSGIAPVADTSRPKSISVINPEWVECQRIYSDLPDSVISDLLWAWESLSHVTCCRSLVVIYDGICLLQIGFAAASSSDGGGAMVVNANKLVEGSLYNGGIKSSELPFLPSNTQAWITLIGKKFDATLCKGCEQNSIGSGRK
ncbi:cofactor assembly of complex C [Abeliophyllum distichum]|uniref:Cofactor assembly of complex C n=1 Tax=Abeliophyllum distichum TaxID=126358 RepID=A0ABD1TJL6_9LAMI